jgi:hypothetical protein
MIIEGSVASFEVAETDQLTYTTFIGAFRVKCFLNPLETIKADRIFRELIGSVNPVMASGAAKNMAFAISQLAVRVIEAPDFFKNQFNPDLPGGHLPEEVLIHILDKAIDAETKFRDQQKKKYEDTQKRMTKKFKDQRIKKRVEEEEEIPKQPGEEETIDVEE